MANGKPGRPSFTRVLMDKTQCATETEAYVKLDEVLRREGAVKTETAIKAVTDAFGIGVTIPPFRATVKKAVESGVLAADSPLNVINAIKRGRPAA